MGESFDRRIQRLEDALGVHPTANLEVLIRCSLGEPGALAFLVLIPEGDPLIRLILDGGKTRPTGWVH